MLSFKPELLKTDVICVKLVDNYVLAGIGNFVYVYALSSTKFIQRLEIFDGTKICGFVPNKSKNKLIIYGETKLKLIFFDVPTIDFTVISDCKSTLGWILAAKWIENDSRIVTVSMNNAASLWNLKFELLYSINCEEKCIAYCADIADVSDKWDDLIILTGTVFSDLLIWRVTNEGTPVRRLKGHKGVLFSICYNSVNNFICTTSDDRSTIVWKVNSDNLLNAFKNNSVIKQKLILHGHTSRIFNCQLTDNYILSAGEDGLVNIWELDGKLLRKIDSHQGGNVWSVYCSEKDNIIISGGSDCSVNISALDLKVVTKNFNDLNTIKKLAFLNDGKIMTIVDNGALFLYDLYKQNLNKIELLECMKSYAILETSPCRNFCALAGYHGDIIIYQNVPELKQLTSYQIPHKPRIFSIHWLSSEKLLTCVNDGFIFIWSLKDDKLFLYDAKQLPPTKERFTTCACALKNDLFAVGDRKGHIYVFNKDNIGPTQCLKKAHNFMGVTNLYFTKNQLISMGKDSVLKHYSISPESTLQEITWDKLPFSWLTYYHAISETRIILAGFKGDNLLIFDYTNRSVIFETKCGGGHRSWDIIFKDKTFLISYIKDKSINTVEIPLENILTKTLEISYQSKEINSLTAIKYDLGYLLISGGEDTTFRIHRLARDNKLSEVFTSKSHLSSIRTICYYKIDKTKFYVFSGGGRAQIIFWEMIISKGDVLCVKRDSYHEDLKENEAENRIMDICAHKFGEVLHVFAGCSDGNIKVFLVNNSGELEFEANIFYDLRCILKLTVCKAVVNHYLISAATDGLVVLWDINSIVYKTWDVYKDYYKYFKINKMKPHQSFLAHSSGINSISYNIFSLDGILFATGGDDNKISIDLIQFTKTQENYHKNIVSNSTDHCAQITGVFLFHNILITTSIDQKIIAYQWDGRDVNLKTAVKYNSSVADIQGLRILDFNENNPIPKIDISLTFPIRIVVYGKGIEIVTLK